MLRAALAAGFAMLALAIIYLAFHSDQGGQWSGLWLNLGTEIIGIVATVAVVDWLFERRRDAEEAKRMAWNVLHEIDHAVWVWQGGFREFDIDELKALIEGIQRDAELPASTQNLLMTVGARSSNTLRHRSDLVRSSADLRQALEALVPIARLRDIDPSLPASAIAECLHVAASALSRVVRLESVEGYRLDPMSPKDASARAQEWRHFGRRPDQEP